jgi:hypothetical protein
MKIQIQREDDDAECYRGPFHEVLLREVVLPQRQLLILLVVDWRRQT